MERMSQKIDGDAESECVSEAGDIGDRTLLGTRHSEGDGLRLSLDSTPKNEDVYISRDHELQNMARKPRSYPSYWTTFCVSDLAVFVIVGVLKGYLLQKLFGPGVADVTSDQNILYLDLPSNMVGSFFMGWLGVVFKADISRVSEHLAIGLTTGYLGSLTTLASCRFFDHLWGRDSQGFQMVSQLAKHEAWKRHFYLRSTGSLAVACLYSWEVCWIRWFLAPNCQCFRCLGCGWTCHCKEIRTNLGIQSFFKYVLLYTLLRQIDPWLRNGMKFGQSTMTWRGQARRVVQQWRNSLMNIKNCDTNATGIQFGGCVVVHMEKINSGGSSIRRRSLSISSHISHHTDNDDDAECESVSEAGDIGDRVTIRSCSFRLSFDNRSENEAVVVSNSEEHRLHPNSVRPLPPALTSEDTKHDPHKRLPVLLDYASFMIPLAVFGILGVFTRYLLQKLFGPGVAHVTSDQSILYVDLPSNMIGSFLMGWFGVVFKGDIINVSEHLAVAITTGYLGSLTTFSGWNQKMLELSVSGHWLFASLGFLVGIFLVGYSIIFGIETAKSFRGFLNRLNISSGKEGSKIFINCKVDSYRCQLIVMAISVVALGILWGVSGALVKAEFKNGGNVAQLWFACMVGPIGVWIRWFLARLNGRGLGKAGLFKWIPFGTLIANVSAACIMAALSTVKNAVNTRDCDTAVAGIQFGLMGCLSTVSTFAAEFNAMRESSRPMRAYAYAIITVFLSFSLGILIYCIPVWTKGLDIDT
ncbi:Fluoride export protein 2 [Glycine soja]